MTTPLHELDPRGRFTDRASAYARARPGYPGAALEWILEGLDPSSARVADVGAGTGIASRQLADRGARVTAVEPNAAMRAAAEPHPRVSWVDAPAERTGLPDGGFDVVLAAQAFHWFEPVGALREFARVLAPGGRLALLWNERDGNDPFTAAYGRALVDAGGDVSVESRVFDPAILEASGLFTAPVLRRAPHEHRLSLDGLLARALSASYVPRTPEARSTLTGLLQEAWSRWADQRGEVTMRYRTELYVSRRAADV